MLSTVVEQHGGTWWFHFDEMRNEYGWIAWLFIPSVLLLFFDKRISFSFRVPLAAAIVIVFAFYSIVKTRMPLFTFPVSALLLLSLANMAVFLAGKLKMIPENVKRIAFPLVMACFCWNLFALNRLEHAHADWGTHDTNWHKYAYNNGQILKAAATLGDKEYAVFNCRDGTTIPLMFYTNCSAYTFIPDEALVKKLENERVPLAMFDDGHLPDWIRNDDSIVKLNMPLL